PPGALWYRPRHGQPKGPRGPKRRTKPKGLRRMFRRRHLFRRFFRRKYWWLWLFVVAPSVLILGVSATLMIAYATIDIPGPPHIKQTTYLYDRNGQLITTLFRGEDRTPIPLSDMPKHLREAAIATEDAGFYHHGAISPFAIA